MTKTLPHATKIVVMGVSGCGKTTIGALIAHELGLKFTDGDSLHPVENVAKMAAGTPLNDADRAPWLAFVGQELAGAGNGLVVACSALKRSYRDAIRHQAPDTVFVHLDGSRDILSTRLEGRSGHFMPAGLLDSQLAILEPLGADEACVVLDISAPVDALVSAAVVRLES
ncbi:gluconokinase [Arthrobacter sp. GMC3]|uniref:gluconokinase n=1 Tax=Arthrobacter sp. GMC3 TaxID=2058894 RepID=UPI0021587434|nr:gluconokinase [Arthrobacter sp. GMC3]